MADSTLDQICDAAHQHLISSTNDLFKETRWHLTNEFGQTIVDQIKEVIPAAPPPLKTTATRKCSQCGQPGHNSEHFTTHIPYPHSGNFDPKNVCCIARSIAQPVELSHQAAVQWDQVLVTIRPSHFVLIQMNLVHRIRLHITHECNLELQVVSDFASIQSQDVG